jgi:LacI family transcriptional regulator, repressor for deo operon, udp, cdd, tsx, nupC, and nupG
LAGSIRPRPAAVPVRASIVDVARLAGVSVATVSRALRGLPNVSVPTRERVLSAAEELEYIASPLAAALVTGRTRSVGVLASYADHWFFTEVMRGIEEGLRDRGYDLVLHVLPEGARRHQFFTGLPVRRRVDALVVAGMRLTGPELEILRQLQLPIACVAEPLEGVHAERIDNEAAARLAVQHLIDLGHTRIAMIGGSNSSEACSAPAGRARGFRAALSAAGLEPAAILDGEFTPAGGAAAMAELLAAPGPMPSAIFCQSDEMAFGALHTLRRVGLRCPEAVSVIGFDDHELAASFDLTTIGQPISEQGAAAARWLTAGLDRYPASDPGLTANGNGDQHPAADALHPVRLVLRGSTASCGATSR